MANVWECSLLPACAACARRSLRWERAARPIISLQIRGKKSMPRDKSVLVRLRQDVHGYGRKGTVVPMVKGQMRNIYFPQRMADYLTLAEKREVKQKNLVIERDVTFGSQVAAEGVEIKEVETRLVDQPARKAGKQSTPIRINLDLLNPSNTYKTLDEILPPDVVFYRTPIGQTKRTEARSTPDVTPQPTESPHEPGPSASLFPSRTAPIYGSVSTGDVATAIKALVATSEVAGRIVIGEEDIRFIHAGPSEGSKKEDTDRVKQLGDYNIQIRIKGHDSIITRRVRVFGEDEATDDVAAGEAAVDELAGLAPIKGDVDSKVLKVEAQARQLQEAVSDIGAEFQDITTRGRLSKEPVTLTPAEEAEIDAGGDMVPPIRGKEVVIEEENENQGASPKQ